MDGRVLIEPSPSGTPDGMRCDVHGSCGAAAMGSPELDGVLVFAPGGIRIGRIALPERCANVCFGGAKRNRLPMAWHARRGPFLTDAFADPTPFRRWRRRGCGEPGQLPLADGLVEGGAGSRQLRRIAAMVEWQGWSASWPTSTRRR